MALRALPRSIRRGAGRRSLPLVESSAVAAGRLASALLLSRRPSSGTPRPIRRGAGRRSLPRVESSAVAAGWLASPFLLARRPSASVALTGSLSRTTSIVAILSPPFA
jgi:hypothetical protein